MTDTATLALDWSDEEVTYERVTDLRVVGA
jgi:hypothetical protein